MHRILLLSGCAVGMVGAPATDDAGAQVEACDGWAQPDASAGCHACSTSQSCQPNGCYNGYWCETSTSKCHATPTCP